MEQLATYLLMVKKLWSLKQDSEIAASPICLGNISKDWSADNMKKTGLNGYVYEFSVDYGDISKSDITEAMPIIHKYLMLKYDIK